MLYFRQQEGVSNSDLGREAGMGIEPQQISGAWFDCAPFVLGNNNTFSLHFRKSENGSIKPLPPLFLTLTGGTNH